ncbi:uncharacterized protein TNCV_1555381 [Trichonephila clavipes]|nr:uncharacterized protein TNCV_1555381 [Trichonephila clavipes]
MLIYEFPAFSLKCRAQPNAIRITFEPYDQMLYHRTILEPHTAYPIPAGTNYIVLTVEKTAFGLDIIPESLVPQLIQKGFHVGNFRKMKKFDQTPYKLPPPTPIHVPAEKRPLEEKSLPFSTRNDPKRASLPSLDVACADSTCLRTCADSRCSRTCADSSVTSPRTNFLIPPEPPVQIPKPMQILHVPEPMQIPLPVQIPSELDPLEPTDALEQLMSFVFEPPNQEPQLLQTVSSIFDDDLISFLDEFEREVSPMNLIMPVSLGGVSASKYGTLPFGSLALHATGGRVRDLVDVVGRLGNSSRREPTLACGVSPILETGFGNTRGTLASERFGPWDSL